MTIVYIIAILIQAGIIIYFLKPKKNAAKEAADKEPLNTNTYNGARTLAIGITPNDLSLKIPDTMTLVYGVVMDWDMGGHMLTLAAYITGAANVYLSTGSGITGGGKNPEVGELAVKFVTDAQEFINRTIPVSAADYPASGCVRFYLLTNKGMFAAQEQVAHFEDTTSPWLALFIRGNTVITEMRAGLN
jgi:hypothetical protein